MNRLTGAQSVAVELGARPADGHVPIACTLSADELPDRLERWRHATSSDAVAERCSIDGGVRLTFRDHVDASAVADLAAAEQQCCGFFTFRLTIGPEPLTLEIMAPPDALEIVHTLVGQPS